MHFETEKKIWEDFIYWFGSTSWRWYANFSILKYQFHLKIFCTHRNTGVQEAFEYTNKVLTFSIHKYHPGFFPGKLAVYFKWIINFGKNINKIKGTGHLEDIGKGNGKYYTVNVPLKGGVDNTMYNQIFSK